MPVGEKHPDVQDREEEELSLSEAISVDNNLNCDSPMKGGIRGVPSHKFLNSNYLGYILKRHKKMWLGLELHCKPKEQPNISVKIYFSSVY